MLIILQIRCVDMRSESHASPVKAMFLAILMVMMVQTGYMDIWNNSVSNDSSLDESTSSQSGSGNSLVPSSDGAELNVGTMMADITFQYDGTLSNGSGNGGQGGNAIAANKLTLAEFHTCAIDANDSLICWGSDNYGQLGDGGDYVNSHSNQSSMVWSPPSMTVDVGTGRYPVSVNTAYRHTCAILDNGDLKCWGSDQYGKLGDGGSVDPGTYDSSVVLGSPPATPIDLGQGRTAVAVAPGDHHACAILDNGSVKCWGSDENGQLGISQSQGSYISAPVNQTVDLGANRTAVAIDSGRRHTCVILDNADMKCWGWGHRGQLGDGTTYSKDTPVSVNLGAGRTAVALGLGGLHTCAILDNGSVKCWGFNQYGALGNGGNSNIDSPPSSSINLGTGHTAVAVAAGAQHTCAILDNGSLKCWGSDIHGQLGYGGTSSNLNTPSSSTVDLGNGRTAVAIGAGDSHTCAILDNGEMKCWGRHTYGQLGIGTTSSDEQSPISVSGNVAWNTTTSGSTGSGSGGSGSGGSGGSNIFYGNNSTWSGSMTEMYSATGSEYPKVLIGDTLYYTGTDSSDGIELHAFNFANMTSWLVDDIYTGSDSAMVKLWGNIGDTLFFEAIDGNTGRESWAHNLSNQTSWNIADMRTGSSDGRPSQLGIIGDNIYFHSRSDWDAVANVLPGAIYAYSTTNQSVWEVADPTPNADVQNEQIRANLVVGDDIYFSYNAYTNGHRSDLYVLNTTTESLTKITNHAVNTDQNLGKYVFEILGDILLYDYDDGNGLSLWAYNTSNSTTWKTGNAYPKYGTGSSTPSSHVSMNDVFYFGSTNGLYAYNTTNETQWRATKSTTNTGGNSKANELIAVGDTIYFISSADDVYGNYLQDQLLAYDTSNDSTWLVTEIGSVAVGDGVNNILAVMGDTLYFRGKEAGGVNELWAHDTSNCQTWNGISTSGGSSLWNYFDGTTLYYHWDDGSDAIYAYQPAEIDNSTTTGCFREGVLHGVTPDEELPLAIVELATGVAHSCAILANGSLACWGDNQYGQLGNGNNTDMNLPTFVNLPAGRTATDISAGSYHSCAILDNASVMCWGSGSYGKLGNNNTANTNSPVYVEPMPNGATAISLASQPSNSCALLDNGKVACWGGNIDGSLGAGSGGYYNQLYPALTDNMPANLPAVSITSGEDHYCALLNNGDVACWGGGTYKQLGILGTNNHIDTNQKNSPTLADGFNYDNMEVRMISAAFTSTCALLSNYSVVCTPTNYNAGIISTVSMNLMPMPGGQKALSVTGVGRGHCAILENLSLACWGAFDYEDIGVDGSTATLSTAHPYTVVVLPAYSNLSALGDIGVIGKSFESYHTCVITTSGELGCVGRNYDGQLGQGSSGGTSGPGYVGGNWSFGPIFGGGSGGSGPARMLVTNATCSISPALPTGLSLTQGTCAITGTPFLGMANTTFTVTAVIENVTYAGEFWLSISGPLDPPMPLIAVNNTAIIDYGPYSALDGATYEISPDLPGDLVLNPTTGVISGTPRETLANTTFTVWANSSFENRTWNITLEILEDTDGDGDPDQLPDDYDPGVSAPPMLTEDLDDDGDGISDLEEDAEGTDPLNPDTDGDGMCDGAIAVNPHCVAGPDAFPTDPAGDTDTDGDGKPDTLNPPSNSVPSLEEDLDDDGDGVEDVNETDTGIYVDETDRGTNPLNPDTDFDGTCDGPVDVYDPQTGDIICVAGPDTELGNLAYGTHYGLNGSAIESIRPEWRPAGAVWSVSPDLPADLTIDPVSGIISGIPSEVTGNVTYTISGIGTSSTYSSQFNLQILEDTDRDGEANELPADYDNTTVTPMVEDLDDDGDGLSDLVETGTGFYNGTGDYGTDPLNPDTDGDGVCDGPLSVWPICINGPDSNPFGIHDASNIVLVENMAITTPIPPPNQVPGAVWEISPALPEGVVLDASSGIITGTPTEVRDNETYTLWANISDFGRSDSVTLSVMATFGLTVLADTDGDGMPDELPDDYDENIGILVEDDDDDNDGMLDTEEATEGTNPLDPDTDGDGFCDGPADVYSSSGELICRGPDPAPLDADEPLDTDGDMFPDEDPDGEGGLVADTDDDNDGFLDTLETSCGSSTVDANDTPQDFDGDTICDLLDADIDGDGLNNTVETNTGIFTSDADSGTDPYNPDTDGDGYCDGPVSPNYSNCTAGPDAFPTDASAHLDTDGDGDPDTITGNSTTGLVEDLDDDGDGASDIAELDCGTDPLDATDVAETDADGNCVKKAADPESLFEWSWGWCFCLIFLLLLLLLIPIVMQRDRILLILADGPEPENTTSLPEFISGAGTIDDPFILAPAEGVKPGGSVSSTEVITIDKMSDIRVDMIDLNQEDNGNKFAMYETSFDEIGVRLIAVGSDGQITINFIFDDGEGEESYAGGEFTGLMKLGRASVYFSWTVTVTPDKAKMREIEKAEKEAKKAEEKAAKEAEAKAKKEAKEAEAAAKKAEEEAAALLAEEEAAANKKAEEKAAKEAKKAEEKAAKEAEAKAKKEAKEAEAAAKKAEEEAAALLAEEEAAAAAALAAKEEEEKAAKEAEAKAKKEAEAAAKKKAEEEDAAAAAAAAAKPANKEEKKKAELKRVKERSKSIDFKVLGKAKASEKDDLQVIKGVGPFIEEKLNALGIYTYKQISKMTSKLEDSVNEAIEFFPGRVKRDQWVAQAKILLGEDVKLDEKALKKSEELARVAAKAESIDFATIGLASASDRDDLQTLKGIGPFIEEKLNALGIFKFEQIAKMTSGIEEEVNIAIEFFPGRVKRDEWVKQAKKLSKK